MCFVFGRVKGIIGQLQGKIHFLNAIYSSTDINFFLKPDVGWMVGCWSVMISIYLSRSWISAGKKCRKKKKVKEWNNKFNADASYRSGRLMFKLQLLSSCRLTNSFLSPQQVEEIKAVECIYVGCLLLRSEPLEMTVSPIYIFKIHF